MNETYLGQLTLHDNTFDLDAMITVEIIRSKDIYAGEAIRIVEDLIDSIALMDKSKIRWSVFETRKERYGIRKNGVDDYSEFPWQDWTGAQ